MSKLLWQPDKGAVAASSTGKLMKKLKIDNYQQLHNWSIENIDLFWDEVWRSTNVIGSKGGITFEEGDEFFKAKFFPDSLLNVGENLLSNELTVEIAITAIAEDGKTVEMTWDQLRAEVASVANAMLSDGVRPKDRVVAWSPNITQTIIFSLAALSIGAVVSTASSDFAAAAVLDRFAQIEPVLLLAASSYSFNGKSFDVTDNLKSIAKGLPTLKRVVVIGENNGNFTSWNDWKASFINTQLSFERFNFDHPGFILFSSGTTGKPKCIIHSAAGVLLKLKAEQLYNFDLSSKDKIFFYTTTGWMMWNWLLYCLASKTSIVLYDGSPTFPNVDRLLEIAQSQNCTHLGVSAKYIDLLKKSEITIKDKNSISNLRMLISTGSVLAPESFDYVYQNLKSNIHLASISGGTDICGCFVSAVPVLAVYAGQIQGACLGMAVDVFDEQANPTIIDQKGELVCTKPFPSMPLGFWNDNNNEIYRKSYFSKFKNIWTHGDYVSKSKQSGFVILGRSDATLNSKGVRIGTAEIYRVVDEIPEVLESLAVAKQVESDTKVILFVVLKPSKKLSEQLISKIKSELKGKASPRHVPDLIIQAPHLPRTKSNKLVEIAVADTINGKSVRNKEALANPEALDWFAQVDLSTLI